MLFIGINIYNLVVAGYGKKKYTNYYIWGVIGLLIVAGVIYIVATSNTTTGPTNLGPFASCLKERGAVFYGAFWCPHCKNQKTMFGTAVDQLPYVECSTPDGSGQTAECTAKGIQSYPTWIFDDGSQLTGEIPLQQLADKTGCTLPK